MPHPLFMGRPKTPERRKPGNAELRSAMSAIELWIRHAAIKNSGVIKVTHHELVTIHDALILALREDNPQSLLVLDTDGGTEVRKEIVEEATKSGVKAPADKRPVTDVPKKDIDSASEIEETILAELEAEQDEPEIDTDLELDLETEAGASPDSSDEDKA